MNSDNTEFGDERETAALLGQLKVQPSAAARERAFAKLQSEFGAAAAPPSRRSLPRWGMAAAAAGAVIGSWLWMAAQPAVTVAKIEALDGGIAVRGAHWYSGEARPQVGATLVSGDSLSVAEEGGVLLRISADLSVRLGAGTHARLASADEIELSVGRVFVDATPGADAPLRVVTPHGVVTHLGTQYLVRSTREEVELAVREGRAQLKTNKSTAVAKAGHWLLHRDSDGVAREGALTADDARFDWIAALPSQFRLEGANLAEFLAWFQRETGLTPAYTPGLDAGSLANIELKGSIDHLDPLEALSYVLATADLAWHREGVKVIIEHRLAATG